MRLRNVKNKQEIMNSSNYLIINPKDYCGKWENLFDNSNPIHLEIGMGKGKFLIENAIRYKDINFIGLEKYDSIVALALQKIPDGLDNLKIIRGNALEVDEMFNSEIETIYLNFSDPWPKKRQAKRRLTSDVFLTKYDKVFKDNKIIIQKTDNRNLFEYSLVSMSEYGYIFEDISLDLHNSDCTDNIMTEFETRFVNNDEVIYMVKAYCDKSNKL